MPNENDLNNLNLEQQAQEQNTQIENKDDNVGGFDEVAFEQGLRKDEANSQSFKKSTTMYQINYMMSLKIH